MSDDAKKTILARRAGFIAAAMAGLAVPACSKATVSGPDAGALADTAEAAAAVTTQDAGAFDDAAADAFVAEDADVPDAAPEASTSTVSSAPGAVHPRARPTVSAPVPHVPPVRPTVCLSPPRPRPSATTLPNGNAKPTLSNGDPWDK